MKKLLIATVLFLGSSLFADCGSSCGCSCGHFVDGVTYSEDSCPTIHCLPDAEVIEVVEPCPAPVVVPACPAPVEVPACPAPKPEPELSGCPADR